MKQLLFSISYVPRDGESTLDEIESKLKIFESRVNTSIQECESFLQEAEEYLKQPEKIQMYIEVQRKNHRESMTFLGATFSIIGASILIFAGASKHLNAFNVILGSTTGLGGLVMLSQRKSYEF